MIQYKPIGNLRVLKLSVLATKGYLCPKLLEQLLKVIYYANQLEKLEVSLVTRLLLISQGVYRVL